MNDKKAVSVAMVHGGRELFYYTDKGVLLRLYQDVIDQLTDKEVEELKLFAQEAIKKTNTKETP